MQKNFYEIPQPNLPWFVIVREKIIWGEFTFWKYGIIFLYHPIFSNNTCTFYPMIENCRTTSIFCTLIHHEGLEKIYWIKVYSIFHLEKIFYQKWWTNAMKSIFSIMSRLFDWSEDRTLNQTQRLLAVLNFHFSIESTHLKIFYTKDCNSFTFLSMIFIDRSKIPIITFQKQISQKILSKNSWTIFWK